MVVEMCPAAGSIFTAWASDDGRVVFQSAVRLECAAVLGTVAQVRELKRALKYARRVDSVVQFDCGAVSVRDGAGMNPEVVVVDADGSCVVRRVLLDELPQIWRGLNEILKYLAGGLDNG